MTRAELITTMRDLVSELSTDAGALLSDTGNALEYLNDAMEVVVLDLMPIMPTQFLKTKKITLVASQADYSLAASITATTIAFVDSNPDTITDSGNAFVTSEFEAGMTITISGATNSGNNSTFTIESVAAGTITLDTTDSLTVEAAGQSVTITQQNPFWMIEKVERNVSDKPPREIDIIDVMEMHFETNVGEEEAEPDSCYFQGDTLYLVKTPSTATADYLKVFMHRPEALTILTNGPKYIPAPAHRMIAYRAAANVAIMNEANPAPFLALYNFRLAKIDRLWAGRYQQKGRYVRDGFYERKYTTDLDRTLYDRRWP